MEVVYNGWLVKSPPEKRRLKAKWRQRWFVLRHSGLLPGQFLLEYYTDESCRKLKGKIDLDQCEQVDAGLTFESRKSNYKFMFDIRTPKRTYYLVAETEGEMNKWVECICSVCGLKIHIDEEYPPPQEITSATSASTLSPSSNLISVKSGSNPYIPISECITGKPITNGISFSESCSDFPVEAPPPPPKTVIHEKFLTDKFYDHPRSLNSAWTNMGRTSPEPYMEDMYKVPPPIQNLPTSDQDNVYNSLIEGDVLSCVPPKVNWNTYPCDTLHLSSDVKNCHASLGSNDLSYDALPSTLLTHNLELTRRETQDMTRQLEHISLNDSGVDTQCSASPQELFDGSNYSRDSFPDSCTDVQLLKPPPRPPKPPSLRERKIYENVELPMVSPKEAGPLYDVPPTSLGVFLSKNLPAQSFAYLKDDNSDKEDLSPSTKVPPPNQDLREVPLDDMYDFPKLRTEDKLNILVPPPGSRSSQRLRHDYTNAPPGLFSNKETVFNYEYRPSLPSSDGYLSMDSKHSELYTDMNNDAYCPQSSSSLSAYANIVTSPSQIIGSLNDAPPVNRDLKPKRKFSDGDTEAITTVVMLAPPVGKFRSCATKRSFRRPSRAAPSPTSSIINGTPPPLPTRLRHSDHSTSDDDLSSSGGSRRNSANEEQARQFVPAPARKGEEIQYLDLDLDSDTPAQSPKSPERLSTSTVYKKVDFVKTKAFNEMRQNVEESYRKSQ